MKTAMSPHMVVCLGILSSLPLSAQDLVSLPMVSQANHPSSFQDDPGGPTFPSHSWIGPDGLVPPEKVRGEIVESRAWISSQSSRDLAIHLRDNLPKSSLASDPGILKRSSMIRRLAVSSSGKPPATHDESLARGLKELAASYRETGKLAEQDDCTSVAISVEQRVKMEPERILEWVESEVAANPGCSCEIVKAAIQSSEADVQGVVAIVETAVIAAPESMRLISQCAIAALPESLGAVQALLAKLDPNAGESGSSSKSAKSVKGAKVAIVVSPPLPNPLDLPPAPPPIPPDPIYPDPVTKVDPPTCPK